MSPSVPPAVDPDRGMRPLLPYCAGAALGGTAGAAVVVVITTIIKEALAVTSGAEPWLLLTLPVIGVALSTFVLNVIGHGEPVQRLEPRDHALADPTAPAPPRPWQRWMRWTRRLPRIPAAWATFPADVARADLTGDVVASAGSEERFPWRQAPLRSLAIVLTVGLGAPMGTEAPAAHLGVATGSWIGQTRPALRRMQRGAAIAGGAAGVSALMGVALVGTVFMLELGRRRRVPLSAPRVAAALVGGLVGWVVNTVFRLDLIRLIVPTEPPADVTQAIQACLYVGVAAGVLTAAAGWAIYRARDWRAGPWRRLMVGAAAMAATSAALFIAADPRAGFGPGGGAILWAESPARLSEPAMILLLVAVLRAVATTTAVAAGGCGGVFVPFLAIGDLAARSFAPHLGISSDLAGASGAAAGIAGGYRLPWTAVVMVVGIGGPLGAVLTSLGSVLVASVAGVLTALALDRLRKAATIRLR